MKKIFLMALLFLGFGISQAQGLEEMAHDMSDASGGTAPPDARDPHALADGYTLDAGLYTDFYPQPGQRMLHLADEANFSMLLINRLEYAQNMSDGNGSMAWDAQAWWGGDANRLVFKTEGESASGQVQDARNELLWGHAVAPFWDAQLGLRNDSGEGSGKKGASRNWLAFGLQGLAPYGLELDAAFYLGDAGRTALRLNAEYEVLWTQRLVMTPGIELNAYGKDDPARGIGQGLADGSASLRLRYEFSRQFAPYIGVEWTNHFGRTADLLRTADEPVGETRAVAGLRLWF